MAAHPVRPAATLPAPASAPAPAPAGRGPAWRATASALSGGDTRERERPFQGAADIGTEFCAPGAKVQLVHYRFGEPPSGMLRVDGKFRVELCLNQRHRSARACFRDLWPAQRFERIGEAFIVPPGMDVAACSDETAPLTSLVVELDAEPILQMFETLPAPSDRLLLASLDIRNPAVRKQLLRLADEARNPGLVSGVLVESVAAQLSVELFRHGATVIEREDGAGLAAWQLRRIDERLRELRDAPTLAELAGECRISVRQLTRAFRASRGCSVGACIASSQVEHARSLLAQGGTVAAIAQALGFASASNFCFAFRRETGMTPGQFRASLPAGAARRPQV